jgi:hypothetical protein
MQNGALVLVQGSWPGLRLFYKFLHEDQPDDNKFVSLLGSALAGDHGVTVKSLRSDNPKFRFSQARVFIPWRYVEGILWHPDIGGMQAEAGFTSTQK